MSPGISVGFGSVDITPKAGVPLAGFAARTSPSTGAHDPLEINAIAVGPVNAPPTSVLLVADWVAVGVDDAAAISEAVSGALGIGSRCVSLTVTQTHSAPFMANVLSGRPEPGYVDQVRAAAIAAASQAAPSRRSGVPRIGRARASGAPANRRGEEPTDEIVRTVSFEDDAGQLLGILFSFACHPVMLCPDNTSTSADWPGYARSIVREELSCQVLFLQGCSGDLNTDHKPHERALGDRSSCRTFAEAQRLGSIVADAVQTAVTRAVCVPDESVGTAVRDVVLTSGRHSTDPDVHTRVGRHTWGGAEVVPFPGEPFIQVAHDIRQPHVYEAGGYEVDAATARMGRVIQQQGAR